MKKLLILFFAITLSVTGCASKAEQPNQNTASATSQYDASAPVFVNAGTD